MKNVYNFTANYNVAMFLKYASFGAVNLYAIITGYVCLKSKHKFERIVDLWFQVVFYTFSIALVTYLIPNNTVKVGLINIAKSLIPITTKQYWYFTAYFCLFLFMPFLNILIKNINKKQHRFIIISGLFLFCFLSIYDIFGIDKGYSFLWIAFMYIIGAYIKLYPEDFKQKNINYLLIYIINILIVLLSDIIISFVSLKFFGKIESNDFFVKYNSIFIVFGAISLFIFCSRLEIKHFKKFILKVAPLSFSVYLISEYWITRKFILDDKYISYAYMPWYQMVIYILITALAIYVICSIIDYIRQKLFELLHIHKLSEKIVMLTKKIVYSTSKKLKVNK